MVAVVNAVNRMVYARLPVTQACSFAFAMLLKNPMILDAPYSSLPVVHNLEVSATE